MPSTLQIDEQVTISALFELLTNIDVRVANFEKRLSDHMTEEEQEREKLIHELEALNALMGAFPQVDGSPDVHGHRTDHESRMDAQRRSDQFWEQRKGKIADMVLTAIAILLVSGLLDWARHGTLN